MEWLLAAFGLLMFSVGVLCLFMLTEVDASTSRWTLVVSVVILAMYLLCTLWVGWPIIVLLLDFARGTDVASALIETRGESRSEGVHARFGALRVFVTLSCQAVAFGAPMLWWRMRAHEPESRRHWIVLVVAAISGLAATLHSSTADGDAPYGLGLVPVLSPIADALHRHDVATVLALNWALIWVSVLAATTWTGLVVGPWTAMLAGVPMLPWTAAEELELSWWAKGLCWAGAVALGAVLKGIQSIEHDVEVARRARRAHRLYQSLLEAPAGDRPPFALYLRRFSTSGTLDTQAVNEKAEPLDFESILALAVRPELRLLALNRSGAAAVVGADYLYGADTNWESTFRRLASEASLIVVIPPEMGSTLTEISWLVEQRLLPRVLFVMPETITGGGLQAYAALPETTFGVTYERVLDHAAEWEAARAAAAACGLRLPTYETTGLLFKMNDDGTTGRRVTLALSRSMLKVVALRRALTRVSSVRPPAGNCAPDA